MGNNASSHHQKTVEPPEEWDPDSNNQRFELVSPMSDLSDPSMFLHRHHNHNNNHKSSLLLKNNNNNNNNSDDDDNPNIVHKTDRGMIVQGGVTPMRKNNYHNKNNRKKQQQQQQQHRHYRQHQTPSGDRRRKSKVIATRDSTYRHESRPREIAPPSSFYFPGAVNNNNNHKHPNSKESKKEKQLLYNHRNQQHQRDNDMNDNNNGKENDAPTNVFDKAKRNVVRATNCMTGCISDTTKKATLIKDNVQQRNKYIKEGQRLSSEIATSKNNIVIKNKNNNNHKKKNDKEWNKRKSQKEQPQEEEQEQERKVHINDDDEDNMIHDPTSQPTAAWQFIDGTGKQLSFNPVFRDSHEGTLNSNTMNNTDSRRSSVPLTTATYHRESMAEESSRRRASDPTSERGESERLSHQSSHASANLRGGAVKNGRKNLEQEQTSNNEESCISSKATSHESSYWGTYYQDAQVLHQEDVYFDRLAYKQPSESSIEPSPMANPTTVVNKRTSKSLLGPMDDQTTGSKSTLQQQNSDDDDDDDESVTKLFNDDMGLKIFERQSMKSKKINSKGTDPSGRLSSSTDGYQSDVSSTVLASRPSDESEKNSQNVLQPSRQSSLSSSSNNFESKSTSGSTVSGRSSSQESEASVRTWETPSHDKSNSNDMSLVQTQVTKNTKKASKLPEETPKNASVNTTTEAFGSAYSYRDKDVFTPITSYTTYQNGSPFRPRIDPPGQAMAKAKMEKTMMFTQSMDNMSRTDGMMNIQKTKSAPSAMDSHDYRDIAYGSLLQDTPNTLVTRQNEKETTLYSPGAISVDSVTTPSLHDPSSSEKMVSDQAINNAAFLFSPSYAGSDSLLTLSGKSSNTNKAPQQVAVPNPHRDSLYSISTLGSRSRSSIASGRMQKISIPKTLSNKNVTYASDNQSQRSSTTGTSVKSVRFSIDDDDNTSATSNTTVSTKLKSKSGSASTKPSVHWDLSNTQVEIPAIESTMSDLTDLSIHRESLESAASGSVKSKNSVLPIEEKEEEEEESKIIPKTPHGSLQYHDVDDSPEVTPDEVPKWTYCELSKGVTPMLNKKTTSQATNSPVHRFKAAKNKFIKKKTEKKVTPVKKAENFKKKVQGSFVNSRIAVFDNGVVVQPKGVVSMCYSKSFSQRDSAGSHTTISTTSTGSSVPYIKGARSSSLLPIISREEKEDDSSLVSTRLKEEEQRDMGYQVSSDEDDYDDQSCDSTEMCESSVATLVRKDRVQQIARPNIIENDDQKSDQEEEDDDDDDEIVSLSDILNDNYETETEDDTVATVPQTKGLLQNGTQFGRPSIRSIVSSDDEDESTYLPDFFEITKTFSEDSTSMSSYLAKAKPGNLRFGGAPVKVDEQMQHQHTQPGSLFLSPTQRTPMQAKKWRQLAEEAKKNDNNKKKLFRSNNQAANGKKSRKGKALSERSSNVLMSGTKYSL